MEFMQDAIDSVSSLHSNLKDNLQRLKSEYDEAVKREKLISDIESYLSKGWSMHLMYWAEKEADRFKQLRTIYSEIIFKFEEAYRAAKDDSEKTIRRYPQFLEEACQKSGISIDINSSHPKYSFDNGFFKLEILDKLFLARLSNYERRIVELPADVVAVVEVLQSEHKRIFGRPYNAKKFLQQIRTQYKAHLKKHKQPEGSSVPIRTIMKSILNNSKQYQTDEFIVDLSRLADKGPHEIEGKTIDFQQTKDTKQGILLYGATARGYVGYIIFKEVVCQTNEIFQLM